MLYHYAKYYLTPVLALTGFTGAMIGGPWMWMGLTIVFAVVIGGDALFGEDPKLREYKYPWLIKLPLHLALPMITVTLFVMAWSAGSGETDFLGIGAFLGKIFDYDFIAARNNSLWTQHLGAVIGTGFLVAGYGTNVAHELTHRVKDRWACIEGRWILAASCNADFSIEHVYGHHVTVGTDEDPATAKRGENVYAFFLRSTIMGHVHAWKCETARLKKKNQSIWSWHNLMLTGYLMSLCWMALFYYAAGWVGLLFFFAQAFIAKFILEVVNYMEHYGLRRKPGEPVGPQHSWNTNKTMSSIVLYTLTRHSAHHEKPRTPFWQLDPYPDAPQMPYGYLTNILICLVPPLWFSIIGPRLKQWDTAYA